jgi:hypothetical protein
MTKMKKKLLVVVLRQAALSTLTAAMPSTYLENFPSNFMKEKVIKVKQMEEALLKEG